MTPGKACTDRNGSSMSTIFRNWRSDFVSVLADADPPPAVPMTVTRSVIPADSRFSEMVPASLTPDASVSDRLTRP